MSDIETLAQAVRRSIDQVDQFDLHPRSNADENRTWYVSHAGGRFIAKLPERSGGLTIPVAEEFELLRRASAAGVSPTPLGHDAKTNVLFVEELEACDELAVGQSAERATIAAVAHSLQCLHQLPAPESLRRYEPLEFAQHYRGQISGKSLVAANELCNECELLAARCAHLLSGNTACHNDLHVGNLLIGDRVCFIDFEYAVKAGPVVDIASYAALNNLDENATKHLVRSCSGGESVTLVEVEALKRIHRILGELWEMARSDNNTYS